jgi:hypothetical protein
MKISCELSKSFLTWIDKQAMEKASGGVALSIFILIYCKHGRRT